MIDLASLITHINNSSKDRTKELNLIKESIYKYPYFQIGYTILAKCLEPISLSTIQKAAIYATDRTYLKALLNNTSPFNQCIIEEENKSTIPISNIMQEACE